MEGIARTALAGTTAQDALTWLAGQRHDWLLLIDNADDHEINLQQFFPACRHGNIIITSRNPACRLYAPDSHFNVSEMNANDAIELLLKMTAAERSPTNLEQAASICTELGYLALAVAQAGAYIAHSCSLDDYLDIYREDRAHLLHKHSTHTPGDYQWTVYTTWEMSLKKLTPTAMMFLRICSFMHHGGISRAIFEAAVANGPDESFEDANRFLSNFKSKNGEWSKLAFLSHTKDLLSYSLINLDTERHAYSMHPLVHSWARDRATPLERDEARACALQILALAVAAGQLETTEVLALRRSLLPHVDVCRTPDMEPDIAAQLHLVYIATGRWNIAEELIKSVLDARQTSLGSEHQDTVEATADLAYTYSQKGRWKEAEELELQVMESRQRVLGEEHPHTLTSIANLANTYRNQGRWKEAEELELRVMEVRRRVLGDEHPDTLAIMGNLAGTYRDQGRWKDAEELELRVMEVRRRVLGEEHPHTLTSMANIAIMYRNQGRWKEAEELELPLMEVRRRVLGEEHPHTLASMANLANTYRDQGRWKEAEELELRVMEVMRRVLGEEHPHTLTSMANLAVTYCGRGRWKEAEELELRVMEVRRRVLGEEHPHTLTSMGNLAGTYRDQGRWKDAEELELRVMEVMRRVLGEEHPDTLTTMANLTATYFEQGRHQEAEELALQVLEKRKKVLGDSHPRTLTYAALVARWFGSPDCS